MWNNNSYEWEVDLDWLDKETVGRSHIVVMSHQPPYSGTLSDEQEERWETIRSRGNIIASVHGHVHNFNYKHEIYGDWETGRSDVYVYTVDRVTNSHYGTMTIYSDRVEFENCSPFCSEVSK